MFRWLVKLFKNERDDQSINTSSKNSKESSQSHSRREANSPDPTIGLFEGLGLSENEIEELRAFFYKYQGADSQMVEEILKVMKDREERNHVSCSSSPIS